jgi:hypothetical protein
MALVQEDRIECPLVEDPQRAARHIHARPEEAGTERVSARVLLAVRWSAIVFTLLAIVGTLRVLGIKPLLATASAPA